MGLRVQGFEDDGFGYIKTGKPLFNGEETAAEQETKQTVTVPVGQPVTTNTKKNPLTGLVVETTTTDTKGETSATVTGEKTEEASKNKFAASRTITDEASFKAKEDEMVKKYQQVRSMSDGEIEAFAKKYVENELPQDADEKLVADTKNEIIASYANIKSMSDDEIQKTAKYYTKNVRNKENFDNTVVYYDKAEYKAAEAERKNARKQLIDQFQNEGLSKKEAKKKADSMLVKNEYLRKTWFGIHSSRKAVENNRELFFDENGKFSNEKYHEFALKQANINNQNAGETVDYTFSLKERRKADIDNALQDASMTTLGKVVRKSGIETERNNTSLYRGLAIAGLVGAGAATGGITVTSAAGSTSGSAAGAAAGSAAGAGSTAGAAAGAFAKVHIAGELIGAAASPLALLLRDNGKKDRHAYEVYSYTEKPQQTVVITPPPAQEQPCPTEEWDEKVCAHTVIPGSSWAYYAENSGITINGKKPSGKMLESYLYAQQLMYDIKNPKGLKENRFLPVGAEYVQHSDFSKLFEDTNIMNQYGKYLNPLKNAEINVDNCVELDGKVKGKANPKYRFGGFVIENNKRAHYTQGCKDNVPQVSYR